MTLTVGKKPLIDLHEDPGHMCDDCGQPDEFCKCGSIPTPVLSKPVRERKITATKDNLIKALEKIGWSVRQRPYAGYIYNAKGVFTHWLIKGDRLEIEDMSGSFDESPSMGFYFNHCWLEWLDNRTVSIGAKGSSNDNFVFFANYEIPEDSNP